MTLSNKTHHLSHRFSQINSNNNISDNSWFFLLHLFLFFVVLEHNLAGFLGQTFGPHKMSIGKSIKMSLHQSSWRQLYPLYACWQQSNSLKCKCSGDFRVGILENISSWCSRLNLATYFPLSADWSLSNVRQWKQSLSPYSSFMLLLALFINNYMQTLRNMSI